MKRERLAYALVLALVVLVVYVANRKADGAMGDTVQVNDDGRVVWWYRDSDSWCVADGDAFCDSIPLDVIEQLCKGETNADD